LGFLPDLKLLLMEAIPGSPQIANELKAHFLGGDGSKGGKLDLNEAMDACAQIAASLHSSGIKLGRRRSFDIEMAEMERNLKSIQDILPDLGGKLLRWLDEIGLIAAQSKALPLCFSHGDFTYTQLIFNENESGLVDFDTVCQAEPALDIGQFLAYQQLAITRDWPGDPREAAELSEKLGKRFLDTYIAVTKDWLEDEALLRERVSMYERISLLRLALHSWQKLKGSRLKVAIALLEEKMAWPVHQS
jgi:thiamine kinase-like enzyme